MPRVFRVTRAAALGEYVATSVEDLVGFLATDFAVDDECGPGDVVTIVVDDWPQHEIDALPEFGGW